jgi:hypothetical protein
LDRQSWYAPGAQRDLLGKIAGHYEIELIETRLVTPRKPIGTAPTPQLLFNPNEP